MVKVSEHKQHEFYSRQQWEIFQYKVYNPNWFKINFAKSNMCVVKIQWNGCNRQYAIETSKMPVLVYPNSINQASQNG